jgi:hypothetical protein
MNKMKAGIFSSRAQESRVSTVQDCLYRKNIRSQMSSCITTEVFALLRNMFLPVFVHAMHL